MGALPRLARARAGWQVTDREQWHAERRRGIGSSDVAAIYGLDPWRTAVDVWREKRGEAEPVEETPAMAAGKLLEPLVLRMTAERLGRAVDPWPQDQTVEHHEIPVMRCTPDAWTTGDDGAPWIVECKVPRAGPWESVPLYYQLQVQHQIAVTGAAGAYVAQLTRGTLELTLHEVRRHDATIARLEHDLPAWWERHIVGGELPEAQTRADVAILHPVPEGVIRLGDDVLALVEERDDLAAQIKAMDKRRDAITDELARLMGAAEYGALPDGRAVTYRARKGYTVAARTVAPSRSIGIAKKLPKGVDLSQICDTETSET